MWFPTNFDGANHVIYLKKNINSYIVTLFFPVMF